MADGDEIVLDSRLDEIRRLGPWLAAALSPEVGEAAIATLELVLVELVSNTIRHGHAGEAGHSIHLRLERLEKRRVQVQIQDRASPIPTEILNRSGELPALDAADLQALPESGLGIAMVQASVDRMDFRTASDGSNLTTIEMTLEGRQEL
jgi:anti-sigma regulatory factor (Ser/Thr protein kinase)